MEKVHDVVTELKKLYPNCVFCTLLVPAAFQCDVNISPCVRVCVGVCACVCVCVCVCAVCDPVLGDNGEMVSVLYIHVFKFSVV